MSDVAAFLLARLAEVAENADDFHVLYTCDVFTYFNEGGLPCTCGNPARVLRQVAAMRRVVESYQLGDSREDEDDWNHGVSAGLEQAVRALAVIFADHPDYREEWAL